MSPVSQSDSTLFRLAKKAEAPVEELPPRFSLKLVPPSFANTEHFIAANDLLQSLSVNTRKNSILNRRRREQELEYKSAINGIIRLLDNNGPVGVAQAILEKSGINNAFKSNKLEQDRSQFVRSMLQKASQNGCVDFVALLASMASPAEMVDAMASALSQRELDVVRTMLEYGADPNDCPRSIQAAVKNRDISVVELLSRAPKPLSPELVDECLDTAWSHFDLRTISILLQTMSFSSPMLSFMLQHAIYANQLNLFLTVLYHSKSITGIELKGLLDLVFARFQREGYMNRDFVDALCCFRISALDFEKEQFLFHCAQAGLLRAVELLVESGVDVAAVVLEHAVGTLNRPLLQILLRAKNVTAAKISQSVIALPVECAATRRYEILRDLLDAGASGQALDQELEIVTSIPDLELTKVLLDHGASPDRRFGRALINALESGNIRLIQLLLDANLSLPTLQLVFPTLRRMERLPRRICTKLLLAKGASGEVVCVALRDAVCDISQNRDEELIAVLVRAGASCEWNDAECLRNAISQKDVALLKQLLSGPTRIEVETINSLIPNALAIQDRGSRRDILQHLVEKGAAGESLSEALCILLGESEVDLDSVSTFVAQGHVNPNYGDGKAVIIAATAATNAALEILLQLQNISSLTIGAAVHAVMSHPLSKDTDWLIFKLQTLFHNRTEPELTTAVLARYLEEHAAATSSKDESCMRVIETLIAAGPNIPKELSHCWNIFIEHRWFSALAALLKPQPDPTVLDECLLQAILLPKVENRIDVCAVLLRGRNGGKAISEALIVVAEAADVATASILLQHGGDINYAGGRAVRAAVTQKHVELLKSLLTTGSATLATLNIAWSELQPWRSAETSTLLLARLLLEAGVTSSNTDVAVLSAVKARNKELLGMLLEHRVKCSSQTLGTANSQIPDRGFSMRRLMRFKSFGSSNPASSALEIALLEAVLMSDEEICRLLISHGAHVEYEDFNLMRTAIYSQNLAVFQMLLAQVPTNQRQKVLDRSLAHAATGDNVEVCKYVLGRGASTDFDSCSAIRRATYNGCIPVVKLLLGSNPIPTAVMTSFREACKASDPLRTDLLRLILENSLECGSLTNYLESLAAEESPSEELIRLLLERGAVPSKNFLSVAARTGNTTLLRLFLPVSNFEDAISVCLEEVAVSGHTVEFMIKTARVIIEHAANDTSAAEILVHIMAEPDISPTQQGKARLLIESGVNIDHDGGQALCYACRYGHLSLLKLMLSKSKSRKTPTRAFAYLFESNLAPQDLISCIDEFASIRGRLPALNKETDFGLPLWQLCLSRKSNQPIVIFRVFSVCPRVDPGCAHEILFWALESSSRPIPDATLRYLLGRLGRIDEKDVSPEKSLIMATVRQNRSEVLPYLVKWGARIDIQLPTGETALMLASKEGLINVVQRLVQLKAGTNDGSLHEAARSLRLDVVRLLLDHGHHADHCSEFHDRRTALIEVCMHANPQASTLDAQVLRDIIWLLLDRGADPVCTINGKSPLFHALDNPNPAPVVGTLLWAYDLRSVGVHDLEYCPDDRLVYSPFKYLTEGLALSYGTDYEAVVAILRRYNIQERFYAMEGPQPEGAVGVPVALIRQEEERLLREERLGKDCSVCGERPTNVPDVYGPLTVECDHAWTIIICVDCLHQYMETQTAAQEGLVPSVIKCWGPECQENLGHGEIKQYCTLEVFERYDLALTRQLIHAGQSFVECAHDGCNGGGWFESDTMTYASCDLCRKLTCIACNVPYHAGAICPQSEQAKRIREEEEREIERQEEEKRERKRKEQQEREEKKRQEQREREEKRRKQEAESAAEIEKKRQEQREREKRRREEAQSAAEIQKRTKRCPNTSCGAPIEKNGGCDHMTCRRCRYQFCWLCLQPYEPIRRYGNSRHATSCNYYA